MGEKVVVVSEVKKVVVGAGDLGTIKNKDDMVAAIEGLHGLSEMVSTWAEKMEDVDMGAWVLYGRLIYEVAEMNQVLSEFLRPEGLGIEDEVLDG